MLVKRKIRHMHEPIMLFATASKDKLKRILDHVIVQYETKPMVSDVYHAMEADLRVFGDDNVFKSVEITKGDIGRGFALAKNFIEQAFVTGHQEQAYIEPQVMIADWRGEVLRLRGSLQCPYYVHKAMKAVLAYVMIRFALSNA